MGTIFLVTGKNDHCHMSNLSEVFKRLREHGIRANKAKSKFMKPSVEYLGHIITKMVYMPLLLKSMVLSIQ